MSNNNQHSAFNNDPHEKKRFFGMNIGSASILLIFVTLCLVSFAALSIVSANADRKLTNKVMERTTAYYTACNRAEHALAYLDTTLRDTYNKSHSKEEYFEAVGSDKSYTFEINDTQVLEVTIQILYPETENDTFYQISNWGIRVNSANDI